MINFYSCVSIIYSPLTNISLVGHNVRNNPQYDTKSIHQESHAVESTPLSNSYNKSWTLERS